MLAYVLYGLFILACVVMVVSVLLQPGKSDAGALFSSSVSSTAFGPRGTQTILAKITIGAAAAFMLVALILSLPAISNQRSVLQSAPADDSGPQPTPVPAAPVEVPVVPPVAAPASNAPAESGAANSNANATTTIVPAASPAATRSPKKK